MAWKEKLAEIYVEITSKTGPLKNALAKAKAMVKRDMASMVRLAKRGALAIGVALAAAFVWATKAAIKQEDAVARLETTLKATGYAAGWTKKQILKLAADLQKVTRFGDETILAMQTMLLTFKNIKGDEFRRATEAALDMATAEAAVSGRSVDLTAASIRLGKALNDPITGLTALRRVGVQFTKSQEDQIKVLDKSGQRAKAQRIILRELESQFGGMARTVDTGGGKIEQMWHVISDVAEVAGQKILDKLGPIADAVKAWVLAHEELIDQKIDEYYDKIGESLEKVGKSIKWVSEHWKKATAIAVGAYLGLVALKVALVGLATVTVTKLGAAIVVVLQYGSSAIALLGVFALNIAKLTVRLGKFGQAFVGAAKLTWTGSKIYGVAAGAVAGLTAKVVALTVAIPFVVTQLVKWVYWLGKLLAAKRQLARWKDPAYKEERERLARERMAAQEARNIKIAGEIDEVLKGMELPLPAPPTPAEPKTIKQALEAAVDTAQKTTEDLRREYIERLELARDYYDSMEGFEKQLYNVRLKLMKLRAQDIARELDITEAAALAGLVAREARERAEAAPMVEAAERAKVGFARFGDAWTQIASQLTGREKIDTMQLRESQLQTKYLRSISEDIKDIELEEGGFS